MQPFALAADAGTHVQYGIDWVLKIGERSHGRGVAIVTYTTTAGEEPPLHTHPTEDEIFFVLQGDITFLADGKRFPVTTGGMMVLPAGLPHTYVIATGVRVSLLVITHPVGDFPDGWGGFVADMEAVLE